MCGYHSTRTLPTTLSRQSRALSYRSLETAYTCKKEKREEPQRLTFQAESLPSLAEQSALGEGPGVRETGRKHASSHGSKDRRPQGQKGGKTSPALYLLDLRARKAVPLSWQVYHYITKISASCPSTTSQIKLSEHNMAHLQWIHSSKAEFI